jgi:hypothetical protein
MIAKQTKKIKKPVKVELPKSDAHLIETGNMKMPIRQNQFTKRRHIWQWIVTYGQYSISEFEKLKIQVRIQTDDFSVFQKLAIDYLTQASESEKILFDMLDRTEGKSIQKVIVDPAVKMLNFSLDSLPDDSLIKKVIDADLLPPTKLEGGGYEQ